MKQDKVARNYVNKHQRELLLLQLDIQETCGWNPAQLGDCELTLIHRWVSRGVKVPLNIRKSFFTNQQWSISLYIWGRIFEFFPGGRIMHYRIFMVETT